VGSSSSSFSVEPVEASFEIRERKSNYGHNTEIYNPVWMCDYFIFASTSQITVGHATNYRWDVTNTNNELVYTYEDSTAVIFIFTWPLEENFTVTLTVTNNFGYSNSYSMIIEVPEHDPLPILSGGSAAIRIEEPARKNVRIVVRDPNVETNIIKIKASDPIVT